MRTSRVTSIVLIVLSVIAWFSFIIAPQDQEQIEIDKHVNKAEDYIDRELYQKAIEEYDEALEIRQDSERIWSEKLRTYATLYAEYPDNDIYDVYLEEAKKAITIFPKNTEYHLIAAKLLVSDEKYKEAYKLLSKAVDADVVNDEILDMQFKTKYAFHTDLGDYLGGFDCVNGYYLLNSYSGWVYLDETGSSTSSSKAYVFAGPVGDNTIRFVSDGKKNFLIDENKVIQGFFEKTPEESGVYSADGFIALKYGEKYYYYNTLGDIQFDNASYDYASTFVDGTAAVKKDNKWFIINKDGEKVSEEEYDDVILNRDKTYLKNGVKSLKLSGDSLYTVFVNDEAIGKYENVSYVTEDGLIAVCDKGKWGFINLKGEVVIEPQFLSARSFSNGFAAVYDGKRWGFINKDGKLAIPCQFYEVGDFTTEGVCLVLDEQQLDEETNEVISLWHFINLYIF